MKTSLEDILRMLPVKGSAASVDFLEQRNEEREYLDRYVRPSRSRYGDEAISVNPVTGELMDD